MKPKKQIRVLLHVIAVMFLTGIGVATAQERVVVIPLMSDCSEVATVTSAGGQVWMDRNLGAFRVAQSVDDYQAYGWLYQWGRLADGHEVRSSPTTTNLSSRDIPGHGDFITTSLSPYDWHDEQNDNLWQGVAGTNNPCPAGFRLPTETEWESERASWSSNDAAGAFASPLKLVLAGYRSTGSGTYGDSGSHGYYWSSTLDDIDAVHLYFWRNGAEMPSEYRAHGFSVRCIKD